MPRVTGMTHKPTHIRLLYRQHFKQPWLPSQHAELHQYEVRDPLSGLVISVRKTSTRPAGVTVKDLPRLTLSRLSHRWHLSENGLAIDYTIAASTP